MKKSGIPIPKKSNEGTAMKSKKGGSTKQNELDNYDSKISDDKKVLKIQRSYSTNVSYDIHEFPDREREISFSQTNSISDFGSVTSFHTSQSNSVSTESSGNDEAQEEEDFGEQTKNKYLSKNKREKTPSVQSGETHAESKPSGKKKNYRPVPSYLSQVLDFKKEHNI